MAGIVVKPRARILHGHDWVYAGEILKVYGDPAPGSVVMIKDGRDKLLGSAIYNPASQIVARRFSRQRQDLDQDFFQRRFALALKTRDHGGMSGLSARREIYSDSDGLPGLIVDRYEDFLVMQIVTLGMERARSSIIPALGSVYNSAAILERGDAAVRKAEGLEIRNCIICGNPPACVEVRIGSARFRVPLTDGHKTGAYLDQAENYVRLAKHARGRRVLDCFSYRGGFAIHCAAAGAAAVTAVESSAEHCAAIAENAALNGVSINVTEANVFDFLKAESRRGAKFDLVILDPPSFTKNRASTNDALRGYKEIHLRAFELLTPGGLLATFSCSHHVDAALLLDVARAALVDVRASARIVDRFQQSSDHPILALLPETAYLSGWLLEMLPGR